MMALRAGLFYVTWYPRLWLPSFTCLQTQHLSCANRCHLRFIARASKKLARRLFHTMAIYQVKLEKEQLLLANFVDIGTDLFAMAASLSQAEHLLATGKASPELQDVVDLFCRQARQRIKTHFRKPCQTPTKLLGKVSTQLLKGKLDWMISGIIKP